MYKRITHLNPALKPLVEGVDTPAEKIPEPEWITLSHEEYEALFKDPPYRKYTTIEDIDER
jgi:hypothetical protein